MSVRRVAAIDIGTVTTRLLIADVGPAGIREVARSTDITHLGEGLKESGVLSPEAMGRVESVVAGYAAEMERCGVEGWRAVATSASRDAANGAAFRELLAAHGVEPEIVPGGEEARLSFTGATWDRTGGDVLVNDIGGGSTELILGDPPAPGHGDAGGLASPAPRIRHAASIDVGSRRVTDAFLGSDPPSCAELEAAGEWIAGQLAGYFAGMPRAARTSVALAGTATTISAIHQRLAVYDPVRVHGSVLSRATIAEITGRLAAMTLAERRTVTGLHPGRAGVIVGGALILGSVLDLAGLDSTIVSEHDILYGIVLEVYAGLS